jgi:quercetin dioxygenase-like cupin family protein
MPDVPRFANRDEAEVTERADGVLVRRLVQANSLDLTEYTVPRGFTTGPSDSELSDKAGYVVQGRVEISTPGGSFVVEAGGAYTIPRGVPHQFTVLEDSVLVQVRHPPAWPSPART